MICLCILKVASASVVLTTQEDREMLSALFLYLFSFLGFASLFEFFSGPFASGCVHCHVIKIQSCKATGCCYFISTRLRTTLSFFISPFYRLNNFSCCWQQLGIKCLRDLLTPPPGKGLPCLLSACPLQGFQYSTRVSPGPQQVKLLG